jgi:hypothetical protein
MELWNGGLATDQANTWHSRTMAFVKYHANRIEATEIAENLIHYKLSRTHWSHKQFLHRGYFKA